MKRLSILLGLIVIVLAMTSCSSNTPKAVAEKSVKCLIDKDFEGYVDLLYLEDKDSQDAAKLENDKKELAALLKSKAEKEYEKDKGLTSYETLKEEIAENGETAVVKMKLTYGNGKSDDADIKLRKDKNGDWKIDFGK